MSGPRNEEAPRPSAIHSQARVGLMLVQVLGLALLVFAVYILVVGFGDDDPDVRTRAVLLSLGLMVLPGVVLVFTARGARQRLATQAPSTKTWCVLSGVFSVLAGLPLVQTFLGLALLVVGLFTVTAAVLLPRADQR